MSGGVGQPLDRPLGHEWASDPGRVATVTLDVVDGLDEAVRIANEQTSGLAAGIVTEDAEAAERFLDGYRGTAAFWNATTRFTDGYELTGAPETGINVDWTPGPRGPVTYRDLWLRQYRVVGDGTQRRGVTLVVKLGSSLVAGPGAFGARAPARAAPRSARSSAAASRSASSPRGRSRSDCRGSAGARPRACRSSRRRRRSARRACSRPGTRRSGARGCAAQVLLTAADAGRPRQLRERGTRPERCSRFARRPGRERERRDGDRRDHLRRQRRARGPGRGARPARGCSSC